MSRQWVMGAVMLGMLANISWAHPPYHHHPHSSVRLGVYVGDPWFYPVPVFPPRVIMPAPVIVTPPMVYVERPPVPAVTSGTILEPGFWYYCTETQAYYPAVKECPGGWQKIPPRPSAQ